MTQVLRWCPVPQIARKCLMGAVVQGTGVPGGQLSTSCQAQSCGVVTGTTVALGWLNTTSPTLMEITHYFLCLYFFPCKPFDDTLLLPAALVLRYVREPALLFQPPPKVLCQSCSWKVFVQPPLTPRR